MNWRTFAWAGAGVALVGSYYLYPRVARAGESAGDDSGDGEDTDKPEEDEDEETNGTGENTGDPPPVGDARWGQGVPADFQKLVTRTQSIVKVPFLWAMLTIVAKRESGFSPTAHNDSEGERLGSKFGIERGEKRGNPSPKFAAEIANFGSGGLFGALASSFAWIGLDKSFMPFLKRKPEVMFEADASAVFASHYFWRVTSPGYANGRKLTFFDVRTGWASPDALKNSPTGKTAQKVRADMTDDIKKLGWDPAWVESLPVDRSGYPGIATIAKHFGYLPTQEDEEG